MRQSFLFIFMCLLKDVSSYESFPLSTTKGQTAHVRECTQHPGPFAALKTHLRVLEPWGGTGRVQGVC